MKNQSNYHSFYTNLIKKRIGASFVGYVETKGKYELKVVKDKVPLYFDLVGTPKDVTPQRYSELLAKLENMYRYKQIYKIMNDSEDLFHVYEGMTGNWAEDKDEFIRQHQALESISNSINTIDEERFD